jgi:hypothetical protein
MIIICDMIEKCSCGIIFKILLIWLPAANDCLAACLRKSACLSAENWSACLRKPACPSAEICLIVCANQSTICVSLARMPVCTSRTSISQTCAACLRKTFSVSLSYATLDAHLRKSGRLSAQTGQPVSQLWLCFCLKLAAFLPNLLV